MTERLQIYKCEICGNIIEVLHAGAGTLVCCGQPMKVLSENTTDASLEKHVPVVEKNGSTVVVKIGSVPHPMEEKHYIEWVQIVTEKGAFRKFLNPGDAPEATFEVKEEIVKVREYCNLHSLWSNVKK